MPTLLDPSHARPDLHPPDRHRTAPPEPAPHRSRRSASAPTGTAFVLVGGLPGSGKTTLLRGFAARRADVRVLDPERHRDRFAALTGGRMPYRGYRPLVHGLHAVQVLGRLLAGPGDGRPLVVHEPATRPGRNAALAALARSRGWRPVLLVLDVDAPAALAGQAARGRVLREESFRGHCIRWASLRARLREADRSGRPAGGWDVVRLVRREQAARTLDDLTG